MRKRITLLIAALMLALTMSFGSVAAFAAPANPHPPKEESGPSDDPIAPGTCVEEEQKGANVTITTHKGNCDSNGGQEEVDTAKEPPGKEKP